MRSFQRCVYAGSGHTQTQTVRGTTHTNSGNLTQVSVFTGYLRCLTGHTLGGAYAFRFTGKQRSVWKVTYIKALLKMVCATALVGLLCALAMAPVAGVGGVAIARTQEAMESDINDLEAANMPGVTTIKDATGQDMAYLFTQRRYPVAPDKISQTMKDAIVSIEDRRFYDHEGVDIQGNFRAVATNVLAGGVSQGASTLDQQYVKNYLLLVTAEDEEDQQAATEQSVARKLREMRMATQIDKTLSKEQILANYLNLVSFGNHAYGIEAAARTYFGENASELTLPQSAMLAGMVQSSEYLNPYTNEEAVTERRNTVLQSMAANGYISQAEADDAAAQPLGVNSEPSLLTNGCIGAGDRGFFCDYVQIGRASCRERV